MWLDAKRLPLPVQLLIVFMTSAVQSRPNVLFIISDDMRAEINALMTDDFPTPTHPKMYTPNLDHLASRSMVMKNMFTSLAECTSSRTSMLTSRRPDTTRVYDRFSNFTATAGDFMTLPEYFKDAGYRTVGLGKILDIGVESENDPDSWTDHFYFPSNYEYWSNKTTTWYAVPEEEYMAHPLPDQQIYNRARQMLQKMAPRGISGEQPFFLAVGFLKPHLPFIAPEKYFTYYPPSCIEVPENPYVPEDMPPIAWYNRGEFLAFQDIVDLNATRALNETFPDEHTLNLRRAYYSSVSYIDHLVGLLLQETEELGLADNTIVAFAGDHGFHLGEHAEWGKISNFELATQAPFMLHIPGKTKTRIDVEQMTEFVDVFPTLAEAAGLPAIPTCAEDSAEVNVCWEGSSFLSLLDHRLHPWKRFVFSQINREDAVMGYSLRSARYRYTEWNGFNFTSYEAHWDLNYGIELYDHYYDPQETVNVYSGYEYSYIVEYLSLALRAGWRHVLPTAIEPPTIL